MLYYIYMVLQNILLVLSLTTYMVLKNLMFALWAPKADLVLYIVSLEPQG